MSEKQILVREVRLPVPTVSRLPTPYERNHRDKDEVQMWVGICLIAGPVLIALALWEGWL